jgi:two-component system, LytTR family, response regulator
LILKCVVTDDEPIAQEILEDYIRMVPGLELVTKCRNAMETMTALRNNSIDILFLDIRMPGINGLEFVRSLSSRPAIIFTTAFPQYAVDGFDLEAMDYLLKPISVDRFLKAVYKVFDKNLLLKSPSEKDSFLFIKSEKGMVRVAYSDILYIESLENYVMVHTKGKTIISPCTMKVMEGLLPSFAFLRIHRCYIINLTNVELVKGNAVQIGNKMLVIGKSFRKAVTEMLQKYQ